MTTTRWRWKYFGKSSLLKKSSFCPRKCWLTLTWLFDTVRQIASRTFRQSFSSSKEPPPFCGTRKMWGLNLQPNSPTSRTNFPAALLSFASSDWRRPNRTWMSQTCQNESEIWSKLNLKISSRRRKNCSVCVISSTIRSSHASDNFCPSFRKRKITSDSFAPSENFSSNEIWTWRRICPGWFRSRFLVSIEVWSVRRHFFFVVGVVGCSNVRLRMLINIQNNCSLSKLYSQLSRYLVLFYYTSCLCSYFLI